MSNLKKIDERVIVRKKIEAIEIMSSNVNLETPEIAKKLGSGITPGLVASWLKEPEFIRQVYDKFMVLSEIHLTEVVMAMVREAKHGNVPAARLVLEHYGKLENKVKLQIESPFDKWLHSKNNGKEITPVEVFEPIDVEDTQFESLPERINYEGKEKHDNARLKSAIKSGKEKDYKKDRNKVHYDRKMRAKKVGLERLKVKGRPSAGQMRKWLRQLEVMEIERFGEIQTTYDFSQDF